MSGLRLAIVDDEQGICNVLSDVATACGFDVVATTSPSLFLSNVRETRFDVIILDLHMPEVGGVEILQALATLACEAQIVLSSGTDDKAMAAAVRVGQDCHLNMAGVIIKPSRLQDLRRLLQGLIQNHAVTAPAIIAPK